MAPAPDQTRREVLEPGEFDLKLAFVTLRAGAENLEDQHRAIGDRDPQMALQVALLGGGKRLVEEHRLRVVAEHQGLDLVGLAAADEERRVGRLAAADDAIDNRVAGRLGQLGQLVERAIEPRSAEVDADQDRARARVAGRCFDGGCRVRAAGGQGLQFASGVSAVWKFTARPGTTVEIACL